MPGWSQISVSMAPGRISFTETPDPSRSIAMDSLHPASANLEPEYAASVVMPNRPPRLDTLTMVPDPLAEHPGQDGQRDGDGGEVVDAHGPLDLGHGQPRDVPAHRDGGVVDHDVEPAVVVPDLESQVGGRRGVREVGRPPFRGGCAGSAVGEHLVEPLGAPGHERDGVAPGGQLPSDGGADARGRAGHQDRPAVPWTHARTSPDRVLRPVPGPQGRETGLSLGERGVSNPRPPGPQPGALTN